MLAIDNKVQYTAHIGLLVDFVNSRHNCNSLLISDGTVGWCMVLFFFIIGRWYQNKDAKEFQSINGWTG